MPFSTEANFEATVRQRLCAKPASCPQLIKKCNCTWFEDSGSNSSSDVLGRSSLQDHVVNSRLAQSLPEKQPRRASTNDYHLGSQILIRHCSSPLCFVSVVLFRVLKVPVVTVQFTVIIRVSPSQSACPAPALSAVCGTNSIVSLSCFLPSDIVPSQYSKAIWLAIPDLDFHHGLVANIAARSTHLVIDECAKRAQTRNQKHNNKTKEQRRSREFLRCPPIRYSQRICPGNSATTHFATSGW